MFQFGGNRACSPELLSKIADVIDAAIVITRSGSFGVFDQKIVYANNAFCKLTGFGQEELIGRSPDVFSDQRSGSDAMTGFYNSCRAGNEFSAEINSFSKSGESFELKLQVTPAFDQVNGAAHYIIMCSQAAYAAAAIPEPQIAPISAAAAEVEVSKILSQINLQINELEVAASEEYEDDEEEFEIPAVQQAPMLTEVPREDEEELKFREMTLDEMLAEFRQNYNNEDGEIAAEAQGYDDEEIIEESDEEFEETDFEQTSGVNELLRSLDFKSREVAKSDERIEQAMASDVTGETERDELENITKSQFLTNMSHDLRTPLNAIIGFSEVIRDQLFGPIDNPRYISYANDIFKSGQELLATVNELMELSEVEPQSNSLEEEDFILTETLDNVLDLLSARAFQTDVKLMRNMVEDEVKYRGDRRKVKQTFAGVLGNAIKYSPSGGKVEITTQINAEGDFEFVVYLKTANLVATRSSMGSLLGTITSKVESEYPEIMMARKFTEMHGGKFSIFNSATSGTEIKITLPGDRIIKSPERKSMLKVIN